MKSVYIHIPFCKKICYYCDFCKFFYNKKWVDDYLNALKNEIENTYNNEKIKTLYIGGGTPSSLTIDELSKLFNILNIFDLSSLEEFTIECNVEDLKLEKLEFFKTNKVNRLSIGVQSFNKEILKSIGRKYDISIESNIMLAKKYFDNINIDLIYGFKNQTIKDIENDINKVLKLDVAHVSTYSLIIENNTRFYNYEKVSDDIDYNMYKLINEKLTKNGYINYEISNYSKEGYYSKHNLVYWNNEEYYGFGLSASSYINNKRITNTKNFTSYINLINKQEIDILSNDDKIKYEFILGFRKIKGININKFNKKYNVDILKIEKVKELINKGYLKYNKTHVYIPKKYMYVQNDILINFI